ncbi:hypothetical protein DOTSEDRAFT_34622 [Dothistroma septosporum NZE10]|uniref:Uncharacterized protein n=1 Tax=Dothistroma septosporum (strain NZE10 / CBS 128990) TaxID=675120 RepID=N1PL94_DOTSN|nr:hypothetical protein DOTSEDRAFT_34622 [Dothistroma septosporum NZE10]
MEVSAFIDASTVPRNPVLDLWSACGAAGIFTAPHVASARRNTDDSTMRALVSGGDGSGALLPSSCQIALRRTAKTQASSPPRGDPYTHGTAQSTALASLRTHCGTDFSDATEFLHQDRDYDDGDTAGVRSDHKCRCASMSRAIQQGHGADRHLLLSMHAKKLPDGAWAV